MGQGYYAELKNCWKKTVVASYDKAKAVTKSGTAPTLRNPLPSL